MKLVRPEDVKILVPGIVAAAFALTFIIFATPYTNKDMSPHVTTKVTWWSPATPREKLEHDLKQARDLDLATGKR
jgi:hypothetical protein